MSSATSLRFDAFLSYNSQDRPAVEEVARRLRAEGLTPYLEVDELAPGREFQLGARRGAARQQDVRRVPGSERPGAMAE